MGWGCGDSSDSTLEPALNDGQGTAGVDGLPLAANVAQALCIFSASCTCTASSVAGTGVFGWSNRYWISEECVAIGGSAPGGAKR